MQKFFKILISAIYGLLSGFAFGQELPFTHYTQDHETVSLPSANVQTVYQDQVGYIWFVVYSSGLLRYNGHKIDLYTKEEGLPDLTVYQVLEDQLGRLWVATNVGLAVSRKPLREYTGNQRLGFGARIGETELVKTTIFQNRLAVDIQGRLWIGTRDNGIIRYRFNGLDSVVADTIGTDIYGEGKNRDVRSIAVRRDGTVWVGVGGGDLLMFANHSPKYDVLTEKDGVPRSDSDVLYESPAGKLWGGCRNGLVWRFVKEGGQRRIEVISEGLKSRLSCLIEAPEGTLWAASDGSGVMQIITENIESPQELKPTRPIIYTEKNGFLSDNVNHIIQDREGNLWFAQLGGVAKLRANYSAFSNYTATPHKGEKPILPNPAINAVVPPVAALSPSGIWVGTSGGGISLIKKDGKVETIQADRGLRNNWVTSLALDQKGRLWMGTATGINCLSLNPQMPPPPSRQVHNISFFNQKAIVAGYEYNTISACKVLPLPESMNEGKKIESLWFPAFRVLYCFADNEWFLFRAASGLPATVFHAVAFDDEGRLWVGTIDGGLFRSNISLTLLKMRELPAQDIDYLPEEGAGRFGREIIAPVFEPKWNRLNGAPSNQIETMIWRNGALWVGTPEGLAVIEGDPPQMTTHLIVKDGLRANNITGMAFSPVTGTLWVGTNGGLAEIDPKTRKVVRTVTKQDGLVDNEVWFYGSVAVDAEGTVYFGTAKGLAIYRPQLDTRNTVLPLLRLERADFTEDNSGNNEIAFEYAALSFANEKLVRYKTRLVGYDKDWSPERAEVKIRYTNLSAFLFPRKYTFEIMACNNEGNWTASPLQYSFSVQPAWWQRWWAFAIYTLLLAAGIFVTDRIQRRRLIAKEREKAQIRETELRAEAAELRAQILEVENARKTKELEEARQLQLSMLPKNPPVLPHLDIAADMKTATEVGGDYYDFKVHDDGVLTIAVGDATGHGMQAGTMVAATKSLFNALADEPEPAIILQKATKALKEMGYRKMYMALTIAKIQNHQMLIAAAGMPYTLIHRAAGGDVEEVALKAMPLGSFPNFKYAQKKIALEPGDTVLFLSDGLEEMFDPQGEILGAARVKELVAEAGQKPSEQVITHLKNAGKAWANGRAQEDDVTMVVVRMK